MTLALETKVGELVLALPQAMRYLETQGIDYCCGGHRTLREACVAAGRAPEVILTGLTALEAPASGTTSPQAWLEASLTALMDHIERSHHAYLRAELPRLDALLQKVLRAHADNHPELHEVAAHFQELSADLIPHLMKEEQILFPYLRQLEARESGEACFGTVQSPIRVMEAEHEVVGGLLTRLREQTRGYTTPADGCATYQALCAGLQELEADTHLHIFLENQLLHPRAVALEAAGRR